jgi:ferrochelatase
LSRDRPPGPDATVIQEAKANVELHLPIGVLFMAYGGPGSLEEVPGYLADVRSGRPTPARIVAEIRHHYERIGGRSPLRELSERQVAAVARKLDAAAYRCYLGMRHWSPWIEEVVGRMAEDGITHAVAVALAPHYSAMSVGRYGAKIADGLSLYGAEMEIAPVRSYHDHRLYVEALAATVAEGLARWPAAERQSVHVVFSAHSLPARIMAEGDPYDGQVRETARLVAGRCGLEPTRWSGSYQSAGKSPEPWLGPQLEDHIPELAATGIRSVLSVPVGFVSEHVEILYDIDIEARQAAAGCGVRLERARALNDDPLFVEALAEVVRDAAAPWLAAEAAA